MTRITSTLIALAIFVLATLPAAAQRGAVLAAAPLEPTNLFSIPTGSVVRSMDLDVSGTGVVLSEAGSRPLTSAVLGLGDIAQLEMGTISIVSSLDRPGKLTDVRSAGLKLFLPLSRYARGVAISFRRSATYRQTKVEADYKAKVGEFYAVSTLANYPEEQYATDPQSGWNGLKVKGHVGMKYVDAQLDGRQTTGSSFWRPVGGIELWKNDARARIIAEINWIPGFEREGGERIEIVRVVTGGVRYFFSKHVTFDIGVRSQSNYGGLAESAIQAKINLAIPTHGFRDRLVGN